MSDTTLTEKANSRERMRQQIIVLSEQKYELETRLSQQSAELAELKKALKDVKDLLPGLTGFGRNSAAAIVDAALSKFSTQ